MKKQFTAAAIIGIIIAIIVGYYVIHRRKHCADFDTQVNAQEAYKKGNTRLDGDHDGIACENLLPIHGRQ